MGEVIYQAIQPSLSAVQNLTACRLTGTMRSTIKKLSREWQKGEKLARYSRTLESLHYFGLADKMYILSPEDENFSPKKHMIWRLSLKGEIFQQYYLSKPIEYRDIEFIKKTIDKTIN